jgi:hypothetical protein
VTLLARLRGWSTSLPRASATAYERICNGKTVSNGDDRALPGPYLGHVGEDLVVASSLWRDHHDRNAIVDEGNGSVLHLTGGVTLGVDVGDLLEFQCALKCDRIIRTTTQEQEVARVLVASGQALQIAQLMQRVLHLLRNEQQLVDERQCIRL